MKAVKLENKEFESVAAAVRYLYDTGKITVDSTKLEHFAKKLKSPKGNITAILDKYIQAKQLGIPIKKPGKQSSNLTVHTLENVIRLPLTVRRYGSVFTQMARTDTKAIYSKYMEDYPNVKGFEVFKIRIAQTTEIYGRSYPAHEKYPSLVISYRLSESS
jgi:hypothetical protein